MKNLFKAFLGIAAFLLLVGGLFARPKADFDKFLKGTITTAENYQSTKYYEKLEFTNKKTGEKKKFSDFEPADRAVFMVMQCDLLSHEMEELYNKWKEELKNAEDTPDDDKEASKKDITEYLDKLMALRKKNAEKVEALLDDVFKKWPNKFTQDEKDYILKHVKEYHDKSSLIKRK